MNPRLIAKEIPDGCGMGSFGLSIVFTDVATSKVVRFVNVYSPGETEYGTPIDDKLRAKIRPPPPPP